MNIDRGALAARVKWRIIMYLRGAAAFGLLVLAVEVLFAFEVTGTIQNIDAEKHVVILRVNGMDRTVRCAKDVKVSDRAGKDLAEGLRSKELKENVEATFTIEPENNEPVIKAIGLARRRRPTPKNEVRSASSHSPK